MVTNRAVAHLLAAVTVAFYFIYLFIYFLMSGQRKRIKFGHLSFPGLLFWCCKSSMLSGEDSGFFFFLEGGRFWRCNSGNL